MKKTIYTILTICLIVGIPIMVMDTVSNENSTFNVPAGYKKIEIDLGEKARDKEIVFETTFEKPKGFDLFIQSDSVEEKIFEITGEHKLIGMPKNTIVYEINEMTGTKSYNFNQIIDVGKFTISLTNQQAKGKAIIGYREREIDLSEFERLKRIDGGDLDNPPKGYEKLLDLNLAGKNYEAEVVHTFIFDRAQDIGICAYTDSKIGQVSLDLTGENSNYYDIISSGINNICDRLEPYLEKGTYELKINSRDADGHLLLFIKK